MRSRMRSQMPGYYPLEAMKPNYTSLMGKHHMRHVGVNAKSCAGT
jgi:hypothetical protein